MIVVDPNETVEYVLEQERDLPVENQSVFIIAPLTASEAAAVRDGAATARGVPGEGDMQISFASSNTALTILSKGLRGWRNVRDAKGDEVQYRSNGQGRPTRQTLDLFPLDDAIEIANAITRRSDVTRAEEGN